MNPATRELYAVADLPRWLAGEWSLTRTINDGAGTFSGVARFAADADAATADHDDDDDDDATVWREHGRLRIAGHDGPASRTLRIVPASAGAWQVRFDDGRPFHDLDLRRGEWAAEHRCGPDTYRGRFAVGDPAHFTVCWSVDGPGRADVIATAYRRRPVGPAS